MTDTAEDNLPHKSAADPAKSLIENILSSLKPFELGLDEACFKDCLEKGEAILLLDGLDEVSTERSYTK